MKYQTHYCLVSAQAAPNLFPLLDEAMKPERVVLLTSPQMKKQAEWLESVIKPKGIKVDIQMIDIIDDFDGMQEQLYPLIESEDKECIALNVTGGNKWMAIAAQEAFRMHDSAVFYVNVDTDKVLFLEANKTHHLKANISLKNYIEAYGYEIKEQQAQQGLTEKQREFCREVIINAKNWANALGQLNQLASIAENSLTAELSQLRHPDAHLHTLLKECEYANLLKVQGNKITFLNEEARFFANGGWIEDYVTSQLNSLKAENIIQDRPYSNLHIQRKDKSSHNEIDACFMANNRLHLIECKTKRMTGHASADTVDTIYKLDSISELGGLASKTMLISYRPLSKADEKRAKSLRITVVTVEQLHNLSAVLKNWIKG